MEKYKHKVSITSGLWDAFKDFKKKYKLVHPKLQRKEYVSVCHDINNELVRKMIQESMEFRMPHRLGTLSIKKNKMVVTIKDGNIDKHKLVPDWKKTWEMWESENPGMTRKEINKIEGKKIIYNMNHHTNGYVMRWVWDKGTCYIPNHSVYYFRPTKANRLDLAKWINNEERNNDYPLIKTHEERNAIRLIKELRKKRKADVEQECNA